MSSKIEKLEKTIKMLRKQVSYLSKELDDAHLEIGALKEKFPSKWVQPEMFEGGFHPCDEVNVTTINQTIHDEDKQLFYFPGFRTPYSKKT